MSKLAQLITAKITNERAYVQEPFNINMDFSIKNIATDYNTKIEFTATFGAKYYMPERDKDAIAHALSEVRKGVIQEVFGEFRSPLRELTHLLYTHKYNEAMEVVRKIEKSMFDV